MHEKHAIKTACTTGLPDDEHMMFQTRRGHKEINYLLLTYSMEQSPS
jgi:hypothetical protein